MNPVYRSEHPRPDLKRENWLNLNGPWDFGDPRGWGKEGWPAQAALREINVPLPSKRSEWAAAARPAWPGICAVLSCRKRCGAREFFCILER